MAEPDDLGAEIREIIAHDGPISVERFMALALTHPSKGYYTSRDPFGAAGDFITSPEISQMFGELLGLWAADLWERIGAPPELRLVELGPGRGALMSDFLRAARVAPGFFDALDVHLVEASDKLADRQSEALAGCGRPVSWHRTIDGVPPGPAIFIANEFFDALPVRHYIKTPEGWRERLIGLDHEGRLAYGLGVEVEPFLKAAAEDGEILEINAAAQRVMSQIASRIVEQNGALLAVDYGYLRTGFGETLQAIKAHEFVDPLAEPGQADLTTHVDFSALSRAARSAHAETHGPVTQGRFLIDIGIVQRAEALASRADEHERARIDAALGRLTDMEETGMGALFKVLAVTRRGLRDLPGFTELDEGAHDA
ncbi:methyltransferase [Rhodoblastus sphagnicola]|uniref:Methyltransferase n=1 Tax=Rhodoblastus sphagnicola TaxID=333368 RepID=A0A2S6NDV5_9HYPH|nr:class I SAM-dependent methyltransferase [Rhodoblastus sphagnicola]MBB4198504.1 SAM-dependent MidA family methyltransferase [Rhodoblastus sphagnicola]PPQ32777.1 methyltransferase [Rhodoblastus sphagnicola]